MPAGVWYQLWIDKGTTNIHKQWYKIDTGICDLGTGVCTLDPNVVLSAGDYTWKVRAWNLAGYGEFSRALSFNVPLVGQATALSAPTGQISNPVNFSFGAVPGSTWYYLWVDRGSTNVVKKWYTSEQAGCHNDATCEIAAPAVLAEGNHTWWIQTWNQAGHGPWSAGVGFAVRPNGPPAT